MFAKFLFPKFYFSGNHFDDDDQINALTQDDFLFLSEKIESNLKRFARQLLIEEHKIVNLEKSVRGKDGCFEVFSELEQNKGSVDWMSINMALKEIELHRAIFEFLSIKQRTHKNI